MFAKPKGTGRLRVRVRILMNHVSIMFNMFVLFLSHSWNSRVSNVFAHCCFLKASWHVYVILWLLESKAEWGPGSNNVISDVWMNEWMKHCRMWHWWLWKCRLQEKQWSIWYVLKKANKTWVVPVNQIHEFFDDNIRLIKYKQIFVCIWNFRAFFKSWSTVS